MERKLLPARRQCETFELRHGPIVYQITLGIYADGTLGEVFITGAKAGSNMDAIARDGAILLSMALQWGIPLDAIRHSLTREGNGAPSTIIGAVVERILGSGPC